uniref:BY PROTMAP: gi/342320697/gb/EGU12636.1/ Proteophosphoglycan 5 [Rhodotorula glutinis ATCC 204091] n=1 Tax=Rhodotorula toruloides TaxID=5286 RepID=A0A0K3C803_RHOTO
MAAEVDKSSSWRVCAASACPASHKLCGSVLGLVLGVLRFCASLTRSIRRFTFLTTRARWRPNACWTRRTRKMRVLEGVRRVVCSPSLSFSLSPLTLLTEESSTPAMFTLQQPHVHLHPQNQRNPQPAPAHSPSSSTNKSPLASSPFFPGFDALLRTTHTPETHSTRAHSPPSTDTTRAIRPLPAPHLAPAHGLTSLDATHYPLYSLAPSAPEIRVLTAAEFANIHDDYSRTQVPENELFPWCHGGADIPHSPAAHYFGFPRGKAAETPSPANFDTVNLRHFRLQAAKYATISDVVVYGENGIDESVVETARKVREAMDHEFERRGGVGVKYNVFVVSDPFTVFERNHPALVAIDSHGFSRNRLNFFEREREEMRVLTVASEIGPNVWLGNTQDVPQAKTRARPLSSDSTSTILDDGNPLSFAICVEAHDSAPMITSEVLGEAEHSLNVLEEQGQAFDEVHRLLGPENEVVEQKVTVLRPHVDDIIHLESLSTPAALGNSSRAQTAFVAQLVDLALWIRSQSSPASASEGARIPRRVLLHCGDGYTETSLLALAYVMLSRRCSAPEAYLWLQHECERSFFVYTVDRETVFKIERRVKEILEREDEEQRLARRWVAEQRAVAALGLQGVLGHGGEEGDDQQTVTIPGEFGQLSSAGMGRSDSGFVDSTPENTQQHSAAAPVLDDKTYAALEEEAERIELELEEQSGALVRREMRRASPETDAWFFGPTFEGHFPSRILPYLYLGNVNHASNALMLKALGITHVVSLGESALHPPAKSLNGLTSLFRGNPSTPPATNSLWVEERLGNIAVLDMKNVADDGIDSIRPCIDEALAFITQARDQGGKILVHCKVGVSRSASIVIAHLMHDVGLDLASAYLVTRSRRLNLLVQPNLPFMAALHAFEGELLEQREQQLAARRNSAASASSVDSKSLYDEDDLVDSMQNLGRAGLKRSNRLHFSFLCAEIARLNERFLC